MIREDNMKNNIYTIEPGLGEVNVDKPVAANKFDVEQSLSRDIGTITEPNESFLIPMLFAHIARASDTSTAVDVFEILKPKA